jgi:hypothetical protein
MLHWLVVGHFDPLNPFDTSEKPYRVKPLRPIPQDAVEQAKAVYGRDIGEYLSDGDGGCVYCNWSFARHELWDRIRDFAYFLARLEHAVVMDEMHRVWWPADARKRQQQDWGWDTDTAPGTVNDGSG